MSEARESTATVRGVNFHYELVIVDNYDSVEVTQTWPSSLKALQRELGWELKFTRLKFNQVLNQNMILVGSVE